MSATTTRRLLLASLIAGALLLAGCDADGDGYDDETGEPVPALQDSGAGCGPGGVQWLCGADTDEAHEPEPRAEDSYPSGCGPGGVQWLCGDLEPEVDPEWRVMMARHEAGHAAIAREYGWGIVSARLTPDGSGKVTVWGFLWKDPQQRLVMLFAGAAAAGTTAGAEGDDALAEEILDRFPGDERDQIEDAARAEAARIVAKRSDEIDRDAAGLLENGRI